MKKNVLLTGSTSGIGKAMTQELLRRGYSLILPVRDEVKAKNIFGENPEVRIIHCDLESNANIYAMIKMLHDEGILFYGVILAAGGAPRNEKKEAMFNDSQYPGETKLLQEENAYRTLHRINVVTKETFLNAFRSIYEGKKVAQKLVPIGSHAAGFPKGDPFREDEEGYVRAMFDVRMLFQSEWLKGAFEEIFLREPGLIRTDFTENSPFLSRLLETGAPKEAQEYASETLDETGFL